MDSKNKKELQIAKQDIKRLIENRGVLFDIMSDMVFLIDSDYVIEYMNPSATKLFGNQCGKKCFSGLHKSKKPCASLCPVKLMNEGLEDKGLLELEIGNIFVEANYSSFKGYQDETLAMVVMRDVTERKRHELVIEQYKHNIENVLQNKIGELKESEKIREQLSKEINVLKDELEINWNKRFKEFSKKIQAIYSSNE